jgi:hypothetical protein
LTGSHGSSGLTGSHGSSGLTGTGSGYSDPSGPHDSRLANQVDPRVDSDRSGAYGNTGGAGGYGSSGLSGTHGSSGLTGSHGSSGLTGSHGNSGLTGTGSGHSDPSGPHDSRLANQADPRVDSDRSGTYGNTGGAGGYGSSGLSGTHGSSELSGTHGTSGIGGTHAGSSGLTGNTGPGPAQNTAGPYKSDMMNKLDPRVDSDLDGSKTIGGNKTYQ